MLATLMFIIFFGLIGITMVTMFVSHRKMQSLDIHQQRAFYAAQSGIEYGLAYLLDYCGGTTNSNVVDLDNTTETGVDAGGNTTFDIRINTIGNDSLEIIATGHSGNVVKRVRKALNYIDVSLYAVYTTGTISKVTVNGPVKQNAAYMPKFNLDLMRQKAIASSRYYPHDLNVSSVWMFGGEITFAEHNINFGAWNFINYGNFVAGNNITISPSAFPLGAHLGTMIQPVSGTQFNCLSGGVHWIYGGMIINGNVTGKKFGFLWWSYKNLVVSRRRAYMKNLLKYTVNQSPIILYGNTWTIDN